MSDDPAARAPELMYEFVRVKEQIDKLGSSLLGGDRSVFGNVSHAVPPLKPSELGFIRSVSWLFVHYNEVGRVSVRFLIDKASVFDGTMAQNLEAHSLLVGDLRTFLQHNLDISAERDRRIQTRCEDWFERNCNTRVPFDESDWACCLTTLQIDAVNFSKSLFRLLRCIQADEHKLVLCDDWIRRLDNYHAPHEFDRLIEEAANDMGRDSLDPVKFRKRHYDLWRRELNLRRDGYDFGIEARKLIELALLTESARVLPITGHDLIQELGIRPGPRIGELLAAGRRLYDETPMSKIELLDRLREINDRN